MENLTEAYKVKYWAIGLCTTIAAVENSGSICPLSVRVIPLIEGFNNFHTIKCWVISGQLG